MSLFPCFATTIAATSILLLDCGYDSWPLQRFTAGVATAAAPLEVIVAAAVGQAGGPQGVVVAVVMLVVILLRLLHDYDYDYQSYYD